MKDEFNLYVQRNGDLGDSAHRTGLVAGIAKLLDHNIMSREAMSAIKNHLELSQGIFIRHPKTDANHWSQYPNNFSRDQASRIIFAAAVCGEKLLIKRWFKQMRKRWFFHQNTFDPVELKTKTADIMSFGEWRNVIRGLDLWWAYPALLLLDIAFIGDVYLRSKWDGASLYVPDLKFALQKYWTPTAWLADWLNEKTPWLDEAVANHSAEKNGCVELQDLFIYLKGL